MFEASSRRRRLPALQVLPEDLEVGAPRLHRASREKGGVSLRIVGGDQKVDSEVEADHLTKVIQVGLGHLLRHRHMEEPPTMPVDEMRRAKLPGPVEEPFHPLLGEGYLHAAYERIEGESVGLQRVVSIPDKIESGFGELYSRPRMAVGEDALVACNHGLDHRLRHLGSQTKLCPQGSITIPVQRRLLEGVRRVNNFRDIITSLAVSVDGLLEPCCLLRSRIYLNFRGQGDVRNINLLRFTKTITIT